METRAVVIDKRGARSGYDEVTMEPVGEEWRSCRTFVPYPMAWKLRIPGAGVDLNLTATFADQEFMTLISHPAFWEGRCDVEGTVRGRRVSGLCFVERRGFNDMFKLMDFFK